MAFKPKLMACSLPGMPHRDLDQACRVMMNNFPEALPVPFITMSRRIFTEGLPCLKIDREKRQLIFETTGRENELVEFYDRYMAQDFDYFAISPKLDPGLYRLSELYAQNPWPELKYIHMDFPGLFTWGLLIKDEKGNPALYDVNLKDIIIKGLSAKVRWRENKARELFPGTETIVTSGDASLSVFSSAGGTGAWEDVKKDYNEILSLIQGIKSIHCCANFDWSLVMQTEVQSINFDAYQFGTTMAMYPEALSTYLGKGGTIAWGIVPTAPTGDITAESPESLAERLEGFIEAVTARGIDRQQLLDSSWITPTCEPATMSADMAEKVYDYTARVSKLMKKKYF
ncbi:MAG: hypothetical protein ACLFNW_13195 [Desulfobacterales bacterium]